MRLVRLSLGNWRGIDAREIEFGEGVTLVEGPNEIGKSTVVEAVRMLFRELDSSRKKEVKAIQPVGQDVGSRVEAEVRAGAYHFVYAKTYNKSPQTTLHILAPDRRQLTGREAHETVEQILEQTVDMALWGALLVDQGEKIGLASLQDSTGLARALDEAAGHAGDANLAEESSLFEAVQAEYERYFTAKTGRPRYANLEEAFAVAEATLVDARAGLVEVEDTADLQEAQAAEARRLKAALPELEKKLKNHEDRWQFVRSLAEKVSAKQKQLEAARTIALDAEQALKAREELKAEIEQNEGRLQAERERQAPLTKQTEGLKNKIAQSGKAVTEWKIKVREARLRLDVAHADAVHLENLDRLAAAQRQLEQLGKISDELKAQLETRSSIKVDDAGIEQIRQAVAAVDLTGGKRDAAATTLSVTATKDLDLEVDGDVVFLNASKTTTRTVSSELEVRLSDLARIRITPSLSVAELAEETREAESALAMLAARFEVKNLEEAVAANQRRVDAERAIDQLKIREREILQNSTREEIEQTVSTLQSRCHAYANQRSPDTELPQSTAAAANGLTDARSEVAAAENELEEAQKQAEKFNAQHAELDGQLRIAQQELAGLEAAQKEKHATLERARAERTDHVLEERARHTREEMDGLAEEVGALESDLAEASPDAVEALVGNARDVLDRATSDLSNAETNLAVLTDRLQQAQADGRFEAMELAERKFEEARVALESSRRRARAAELLWATLNRHRDAAREAYVRPLKDAVERLGAIVFGSSFEIAIGEDWSIDSRTLHGKTLAFEDLSVGAKEQLGILYRLAAAQIVSSQGGVPLIIDDALGFADPTRLETMGAAIAAAGKTCQIIILTCTPGRFTHVGNAKIEKFVSA